MMRAMASGDDIRAERIKKIEVLKAAGMESYPSQTLRDTTIADFFARFDDHVASEAVLTVAGRVMSIRGQGGIMFANLFDGTARGQVVFQKGEFDESLYELFQKTVDTGDFIEVKGVAFVTKRGERSLKATSWRMLAKSLRPLPSEWYGIKDEELILRERYVDILLNENVRAMFERRSKFWQAMRDFLLARSFMEVETPVLESSPGGADARPFVTHHNALDMDVYMRISLELWQKRLLIAGFPKVFEIGRIFRNEGQSREHLQDYTQLETYEAFADMHTGMQFVQDLYRHVVREVYGTTTFTIHGHEVDFLSEWQTIHYCDIIEERFGFNVLNSSEEEAFEAAQGAGIVLGEQPNKARAVDLMWKSIRKSIVGPAFLVGVPVFMEPLAKRSLDNSQIVERFQVLIAGSEMGKGYSELNDPQDQRSRFEDQQRMRDAGDDEAQRLDEEFVSAMEYGMPPAFGFGVSERLFSFLENRPIHEAQFFPLLRPRN